MDVNLDAHDLIMSAHYAGIIEGVKSVQVNNCQVSNKKIANQTDFAIHYAGMLGEVAVSKVLKISIRTDITIGGDGYIDMSFNGQTIQIKTSTHARTPEPRLLIFTKPDDFATDWAILCSAQSPSIVRIHGFISRKKFLANMTEHNFGYGKRYVVPEKMLAPINKFHEAIETINIKVVNELRR
jgi:hypothetical protein